MEVYISPTRDQWPGILKRPTRDLTELHGAVSGVMERVRRDGDRALIELTEKFDGVSISDLRVGQAELSKSTGKIPDDLKGSIDLARRNIERFHTSQKVDDSLTETMPGVRCWTRTVAIERVGLYIPGGTAPLFSTVLMLGIPAKLAGCAEVIICTPPGKNGKIPPSILYCAHILGIDRVFRVGGAQAIAAMAYGTESIPKVDKIFGPGNQYVTVAKQLVSLENVAIDMPAGPSEVAVMADETADPGFIASDLISQAEHGSDSQVLLISSDMELIEKVKKEIDIQMEDLPRKELTRKSLDNSKIIYLNERDDILEMVNEYAPEHLILMCRDYGEAGIRVRNAGSVFMGPCTPESAGDYASGTNHTLPTGGYARSYGGLGLADYQKRISFQEISPEGLRGIGPSIIRMAMEEELDAHARAVEIRLNKLSDNSK